MKRILALLLTGLMALPVYAQHNSARGYSGGINPEQVTVEKPSDTFSTGGGTTPVQIHTHSEEASGMGIVLEHAGTTTRIPGIGFTKARGTIASPTIVSSGDVLGQLLFYGYDGVDYEQGANIKVIVTGTPGSNDMPGRIEFRTTPNGSATPTLSLTISDTANSVLTIEGSIKLLEQALADVDVAGYGQVWIKSTVPNELWFTDDTGVDFEIGSPASGISGSGTSGTIAKWSGSTVLTDSIITESGTEITVAGTIASGDLTVTGLMQSTTVGVGIALTDGTLHVHKATAGTVAASPFSNLGVFEDSIENGISILTPDANNSNIYFGSPSDNIGAIISWNHNAGDLLITTNKSGAIVRIGTSDSAVALTLDENQNATFAGDIITDALGVGGAIATTSIVNVEGTVSLKEQSLADADTATYGQLWVKDTIPNELWFTNDAGSDARIGIDSGVSSSFLTLEGTVSLKEQLTADASTPAYGQVWVKQASPNELWFTDDAGTDFILGGTVSSDITGSGTANKLPKFTAAQVIADSIIAEVSSEIGVNTILPSSVFDVRDSGGGISTVSTSETVVVDGTILGRIDFSSPEEISGTDALLPAASIWGEADASFGASVNTADLVFATAESEIAVEKMRLTSVGNLLINTGDLKVTLGDLDVTAGNTTLGGSLTVSGDIVANGGFKSITTTNASIDLHVGPPSGKATMNLWPDPVDGQEALIRIFRGTDTVGAKTVKFYEGLNSTNIHAQIGVDGQPSYFQIGGANFGIGIAAAALGKLHVDQSSTSGAIPVLTLDQGDIDDTFINLIGTSAADGTRSISSDTTEDSTKFGAIRVEINGVTKWIRIYDNES